MRLCVPESEGGPGAPDQVECSGCGPLVYMALQSSIPHRVPALSASNGHIDDSFNSRAEDTRHGHNYIDNLVDQLDDSSEGEHDDELELYSEELYHDDGFDRVEDEDWEIVEKGEQITHCGIFSSIMISARLYQTV